MSCTALVIQDSETPLQYKQQIALPSPGPNQVLVKISHVAQNPTDVQAFDLGMFPAGSILGCDFVGTVAKLGDGVTRFKDGDVIAGLIWGGEHVGLGGYSEYTIADEKICFPVSNLPHDAMATVPLAACTSLLALFSKESLNIDMRACAGKSVLVWGGASSVGLYAIQIAALYGMEVITTCSRKHFDTVKELGATYVFDYKDDNVVEEIKRAAPEIHYVFDTIGKETTSQLASQTIHTSGGTLCTVRPGKAFTENVTKQTEVTDVLVWTAFYTKHQYKDFVWPPNEFDNKISAEFFAQLPELLISGKIKPNKTRVLKGLDSIPVGFQEHRDGRISGYKIVYEL